MAVDGGEMRPKRADAARNRDQVLSAARELLTDASRDVSMAEVARRAGVGMATLYRNFPSRRALLEALYAAEVDKLVAAAGQVTGSPGEALIDWLRHFAVFHGSKHPIAAELLRHTERTDPVFDSSRDRVLAAGAPLFAAARDAGEVRPDVSLAQVLDLVIATTTISGDARYIAPLLDAALRGLSPETGVSGARH